jgi:hypothetical protein
MAWETPTFVQPARALLATMMLLALSSCIKGPSTTKNDAGTAGGGAGGATGVECGPDPTSGVTLCVGTTACPHANIDLTIFPSCGYKTITPSFDLECVCNGNMLCQIGVAATCADVAPLLAKKTSNDICNGNGACVAVSPTPPGTGGSTSSTCDPGCRSDCAGSLACEHDVCGC